MKKTISALGVLALVLLICGFIFGRSKPQYNLPLTTQSAGQPPSAHPQDDQTLIFVALSGGGTRAAALSWKTLEVLKTIPYTYEQNGVKINSTLADEIDYISGISGGSFAAAGWCLYRDSMDVFRQRFVERDIQQDLIKGLFIPPWQGLRCFSKEYDRINMASELYDREVFLNKTFGDVPAHPFLWIHATNLALGDRFTFTQEYFDNLKSDGATYPIGYACAASSAFPILLSPLTLINYGPPDALESDKRYQFAQKNRNDIEQDFYCKMREFYNDKEKNKYIHLADGGLVDNQGLQSILNAFEFDGLIDKRISYAYKDNPLKRLIIINVNAGVHPEDASGTSPAAPGIPSVIEHTMVTSMDILSAKRWKRIVERCGEIYQHARDAHDSDLAVSQLEKPYTIEINFRNIPDATAKAKCNALPTSFNLNKEQHDLIKTVVPMLIEKDPDMQRLKEALGRTQ